MAELDLDDPGLRVLLAQAMHDAEPRGWLYLADVALDTLRQAAGLARGAVPGAAQPVDARTILGLLDRAVPHLKPAYLAAVDNGATLEDTRILAAFLRKHAREIGEVADMAEARAGR